MAKPELILLALDDSPALHLMERALRAAGYEIASAHDAGTLDKALQESSPSLMLIGEKFNQENGIKIAEVQLDRFPTLPIILFAEKDTTGTVKAVLRSGLSGYLYPPLKTENIVESVERSLARASHLGDWVRREVKRTTSSLAERAKLSESERVRLESIIASIEDGVIVLDENQDIVFINRVVREAFGLGDQEVVSQPLLEAIDHPDLRAFLARSSDTPVKYHELNFDDGRIFNAQHTPIPNIGSAITMVDITYLKKLDQLKNDFVHTVSHDLRSPLTAVMGYTELVQRAGPLNEQQEQFLHRIQASVQSITTLVNDLLDLGRLEAGFDARRESVHLENILQYTLDMLDGLARKKNIKIEKQIVTGLPALRANPIRIRQMLDNLIGNALKYTPDGGKVQVGIHAEDSQVILQVSDTGPGIPTAEQGRIFEKFYRASNIIEATRGSGLGLAIVKSIVESHQGRVWVESVVGQGSSFIVVLPAYEP
jgi:PAS domain S-box-containing protein